MNKSAKKEKIEDIVNEMERKRMINKAKQKQEKESKKKLK